MLDTIFIGVFLGGMLLIHYIGYRQEKALRERHHKILDMFEERDRMNVGRIPEDDHE